VSVKTLAVTGGTGFVGSTLITLARAEGWHIRALTRQHRVAEDGLTWIEGTLDQADRLTLLAQGSDAIIHVAGVTNAPSREAFEAGNVSGTLNMVEAAKTAGVERFIHVSSLAAREANLSNYGWSKAKAESIVAASGLDWTMVRPPGVYGPGDKDMLDVFKVARYGWLPMPPTKRMSWIEVSDLGRCLLSVIPYTDATAMTYEVDDGRENGWSTESFGKAIGWAVDTPVTVLQMPKLMLRIGARLDRLFRRDGAKLTKDRVSYMCHPDWTIDTSRRPPKTVWLPQISTRAGLKSTALAYRAVGWM
jgi:nucleoside-diphosphate-sugar epimerase